MAAGTPVGLPAVATLAEEFLDDARHARPLRFVHAPVDSTGRLSGGRGSSASGAIRRRPTRSTSLRSSRGWCHSIPSGRAIPLLAVLAALLVDCGMTTVPAAVLARAGELTPAERRMVDAHAQAGAE